MATQLTLRPEAIRIRTNCLIHIERWAHEELTMDGEEIKHHWQTMSAKDKLYWACVTAMDDIYRVHYNK